MGSFRQWETQMATLIECGTEEVLSRYSELLEGYTEADGFDIEGHIERALVEVEGVGRPVSRSFCDLSGGGRILVSFGPHQRFSTGSFGLGRADEFHRYRHAGTNRVGATQCAASYLVCRIRSPGC